MSTLSLVDRLVGDPTEYQTPLHAPVGNRLVSLRVQLPLSTFEMALSQPQSLSPFFSLSPATKWLPRTRMCSRGKALPSYLCVRVCVCVSAKKYWKMLQAGSQRCLQTS